MKKIHFLCFTAVCLFAFANAQSQMKEQIYTSLEDALSDVERVQYLDLSGQKLTAIPKDIGKLTKLTTLKLSNNTFFKSNEDELGKIVKEMPELRNLYIEYAGVMAFPDLSSLKNLKVLVANGTTFDFSNLPKMKDSNNLKYWAMNNTNIKNKLGELDFTNLQSLRYVSFVNAQITALPVSLGKLKNLEQLHLNNNLIRDCPALFDLSNLEVFSLANNQLTKPPVLGNLKKLKSLYLQGNYLTALPTDVVGLENLLHLYAENNRLSNLPTKIFFMPKLLRLVLNNNQLTVLPTEVSKESALRFLLVADNKLTYLPPALGNMNALESLDISDNRISTLPPTFAALTHIKQLQIERNHFNTVSFVPESWLKNLDTDFIKLCMDNHILSGNINPQGEQVYQQFNDFYLQKYQQNKNQQNTLQVVRIFNYGAWINEKNGQYALAEQNAQQAQKYLMDYLRQVAVAELKRQNNTYNPFDSTQNPFDTNLSNVPVSNPFNQNTGIANPFDTNYNPFDTNPFNRNPSNTSVDDNNEKKIPKEKITEKITEQNIKDKINEILEENDYKDSKEILGKAKNNVAFIHKIRKNIDGIESEKERANRSAQEASLDREEAEKSAIIAEKNSKRANENAKSADENAYKAKLYADRADEAKKKAENITKIAVGVGLLALLLFVFALFMFVRQRIVTKKVKEQGKLIAEKSKEIEAQQTITQEKNQELEALAEELRQQSETVQEQRDDLIEKNNEMETLTEELRQQNDIVNEQRDNLEMKNAEMVLIAEKLRQQSHDLIEKNNEMEALTEELRQQAEALEATNTEMQAMQQTKDLMISAVNHDLRNPLNPILNYSKAGYQGDKDERLAIIHDRAKMMFSLIGDIMDVYRADKLTVTPAVASAHKAASEAIHVISDAKTDLPEIVNEVPEGLEGLFEYKYIERVLENILSNAVKYSDKAEDGGKVIVSAKIIEAKEAILKRSPLTPEGGTNIAPPLGAGGLFIRFSVSDNGMGIPEDKFEEIFKPFTNPNARSIGSAKSVGIGLTFCKTIVEAHGSIIQIDSTVGEGTTFSFDLPYAAPKVIETKQEITQEILVPFEALTADERAILADTIAILGTLELCTDEMATALESIDTEGKPNIARWKRALLDANDDYDEEAFKKLI